MAERPRAYWIGLFKFGAGFWKWSDGTQLNGYENWRDGKPNAQNLNCGQIRKGTGIGAMESAKTKRGTFVKRP